MRAGPLAGLASVAVLSVIALAELAFSHRPALAAETVGAAVAVCGFVLSAVAFLLPRLRERTQGPDTVPVTALPVLVPTGVLPSIVRDREAELTQLQQLLRRPSGDFVVLAGMGGVGKSTIASAFAERVQRARVHWRRRVDVWFVSATDPSSLTSALVTVARELGAAPADVEAIGTGKTDAADRLWRLLQHARHKWLLVLDNADDPAVLARPVPVTMTLGASAVRATTPADGTGWVRPTRRGLTLVTSRNGDPSCWGRHARILPLDPLADADATQVLLDRAPHAGDYSQARALAQRLGGLPLALRTAGSYLSSDPASVTSFRDYEIELMLTQTPELKMAGSEREIPIQTFEISLNDLNRKGVPQARLLLRLLSCYASPTPIPRHLLRPEAMREMLLSSCRTDAQHELEQGLQELKHLSLIGFEQADDESRMRQRGIVVHPVIADTNRKHLRADDDPMVDAARVRCLAVDLLVGQIDDLDDERPADWSAFYLYGPHLHALFETVSAELDKTHLRDLLRATAMNANAHFLSGAIAEAKRLAQAALNRLNVLPEGDLDSLRTRHHLAWFLVILRQPREAETVYRTVLAARERLVGPEDPDTLWTCHELAWLAASEGRWAKAEQMYRDVLAVWIRTRGYEHPDTLMTRHELAWAIANQGRGQEAEQLLIEILAARQKILGKEHHRTLWTLHELAWAIASQGRWAEAERIYRDVLNVRRRVLRPNHPDILTASQELAWTVAAQGHHNAALKLYLEVLAARRGILGEDDPDTIATATAVERLRQGETTVPRHIA